MIDVIAFQTEVGEWSRRNFGDNNRQPPHRPLLGIVEELSELQDASERSDVADAIGDAMVYIADYCSRSALDLHEIMLGAAAVVEVDIEVDKVAADDADWIVPQLTLEREHERSLLKYAGKLCHAHLKKEQGIRVTEDHVGNAKYAIGRLVIALSRIARRQNIDFEEAVMSTWTKVSKRDWKANPSTGAV